MYYYAFIPKTTDDSMHSLTTVVLAGIGAFNEDPVSLPPIIAFFEFLSWLVLGYSLHYLITQGKIFSIWLLLFGVLMGGLGLAPMLIEPDKVSFIVLAVLMPFIIGGFVLGWLGDPENTSLRKPAKSIISRDNNEQLVIKFRRHSLIWRGLFFVLASIGVYWTFVIPLLLAPLGTKVPVRSWVIISLASSILFFVPFVYTMMVVKKIVVSRDLATIRIEEKKTAPQDIPLASVSEVSFDRGKVGKSFLMRVSLSLKSGPDILVDEGTNGRYLYRLAERLAAVVNVPFRDLQE